MVTSTGLGTVFNFAPLTNVAPFTYRDGTTYLQILEKLREYITDVLVPAYNQTVDETNAGIAASHVEMHGILSDALVEIDRRIMVINNRVGPAEVQHIELIDSNYTLSVDIAEPDNHVIYFEITQDENGGHRVTLASNVHGPLVIDETPLSTTTFALFPDGQGNWRVITADNLLIDAFLSGGEFFTEMVATFADKETQTTVNEGRLSVESLAAMFGTVDTKIAGLDNRFSMKSVQTTVESGRLSPTEITKTVQNTVVNSRTFMPYTAVSYGNRNGYRYEMVHVRMHGKPRSGVLRKGYANGFLETAGKYENFKGGPDKAQTLQEIGSRYQADVAFNSTGWQTATDETQYRIRGVQITDGVIWADFETSSNRGRHALGVHADGTIKPYKVTDGWTAQKMVDAGVVDTFGFGPLLVVDGVEQNVEAETWASSLTGGAVSGRTIIGVMANHDIGLITVVGESAAGIGVGGNGIAELAKSRGLHHAILLDGGGSTQAMANGITFHPSSDSSGFRTMTDCGLIYARVTQTPDSGPEPLFLNSSVVLTDDGVYTPSVSNIGGMVSYFGRLSPAGGGNFPANTWIEVGDVPNKARPKIPVGAGVFYETDNGRVQIRAYGKMSVNLPVAAPNITLSGITYRGF